MEQIDVLELEKTLIDKCIALYTEIFEEHDELSEEEKDGDIDYGTLPQDMFIRKYDALRKTEHYYKLTFAKAWMYRNNMPVTVQDNPEYDDPDRSGMYNKHAKGDFYWDLDRMKAFVNMTFGPRYARGFSYDISLRGDEIFLENESVLWVS